jgi:hypothetical protein
MFSLRTQVTLFSIILISFFLIKTEKTSADLYAERVVRSNNFTATTLSFSTRHTANNAQVSFLFNSNGFQPEGFDLKAVRIKKDGKMDFKYRLKYIKKSGDDDLCNQLNLTVIQNWQQKYQGRLSLFSLDSNIPASGKQDWIFYISLDDNQDFLKNKVCEFDFYFKTWRDNPDDKKGFYAQRSLPNYISSGNW